MKLERDWSYEEQISALQAYEGVLEWIEKWIASVEKKLKNAESRKDEMGIKNLKETLRRLNSIADVLAVWEGLRHEGDFTG